MRNRPARGANARRAVRALPRTFGELKRLSSLLVSLSELGWSQSARRGMPIDADGQPVPWFSYGATMWLQARVGESATVFEYGAGQSTLWFAGRVGTIVSVESDEGWASRLRPELPANAEVLVRRCQGDSATAPAGDPYVAAIAERDDTYDVVVVDGLARVTCMEAASAHVARAGIIILDNADRPAYRAALALMNERGFGRLDFVGPVPGAGRQGTTSVFGRDLAPWLSADVPLPHLGY